MSYSGYPERDLVKNRSSLLLFGGTQDERRAWADEAAQNFEFEGPLRVVNADNEWASAVSSSRGVVYIPDVGALSMTTQGELVRLLRSIDDRPKLIVGVSRSPQHAREAGHLRSDLEYSLQMARVNLDEPGLKDAVRIRRARAPKRPAPAAAAPARRTASTPARPAKTNARRKPASRKPSPKPAKGKLKNKPKAKAAPKRTPASKKSAARRRR